MIKNIVRYNNRKLYCKELSRYVTAEEILNFPVGSFRVITYKGQVDVTQATLLNGLSKSNASPEVKIRVMNSIVDELSQQEQV